MKTEYSKIAVSMTIAALVTASTTSAQHVTRLEVRKESGNDHRTTVEIHVPMDLQGFDFDNPVDAEGTGLAEFTDDQGRDLLQIHENQQAELREQGYATEPAMSFGGVADYNANKDIELRISVDAAASDEARMLHLAGKAVLNFSGEGEPRVVEITDVPVEMPYDSEGFASEIGPIIISSGGSAELNDVTYRKFTVSGTENSVISAKPVGGDDSAEVEFWSVNDNQFVLKEIPEVVALQVRYTPVRKVPVEFDLEFSVGL